MRALDFIKETLGEYLNAERDGSGRWSYASLWRITRGALRAMYEGGEGADFYGFSMVDINTLPEIPADVNDGGAAILSATPLPIADSAVERLRRRVLELASAANVPGSDPARAAATARGLDGRSGA